MTERRERITMLIAGVLRQALVDHGASGFVILGGAAGTDLCLAACSRAAPGQTEVVHAEGDTLQTIEQQRARARLLAAERNALLANPASKTALLLGQLPPEPLLPLGDLYETQISELCGLEIEGAGGAAAADPYAHFGGTAAVDLALTRWFEERRSAAQAVAHLPEQVRGSFLEVVRAGRDRRRRIGLVPKLSTRTLGVDLFD